MQDWVDDRGQTPETPGERRRQGRRADIDRPAREQLETGAWRRCRGPTVAGVVHAQVVPDEPAAGSRTRPISLATAASRLADGRELNNVTAAATWNAASSNGSASADASTNVAHGARSRATDSRSANRSTPVMATSSTPNCRDRTAMPPSPHPRSSTRRTDESAREAESRSTMARSRSRRCERSPHSLGPRWSPAVAVVRLVRSPDAFEIALALVSSSRHQTVEEAEAVCGMHRRRRERKGQPRAQRDARLDEADPQRDGGTTATGSTGRADGKTVKEVDATDAATSATTKIEGIACRMALSSFGRRRTNRAFQNPYQRYWLARLGRSDRHR